MLKKHEKKDKYEALVPLSKLAEEMDYAYSQLAKLARSGQLRTQCVDGIFYSTRRWMIEYLEERAAGNLDKLPLNLRDYLLKHSSPAKSGNLEKAVKSIRSEDDWTDPEEFLVENWSNTAAIEIERQVRAIEKELSAAASAQKAEECSLLEKQLDRLEALLYKEMDIPDIGRSDRQRRRKRAKTSIFINTGHMFSPWSHATTVVVWTAFSLVLAFAFYLVAPSQTIRLAKVVDKPFSIIASRMDPAAIMTVEQFRNMPKIPSKVLSEYIRDYSWYYKVVSGQAESVYKLEAEEITGRVAGAYESAESETE